MQFRFQTHKSISNCVKHLHNTVKTRHTTQTQEHCHQLWQIFSLNDWRCLITKFVSSQQARKPRKAALGAASLGAPWVETQISATYRLCHWSEYIASSMSHMMNLTGKKPNCPRNIARSPANRSGFEKRRPQFHGNQTWGSQKLNKIHLISNGACRSWYGNRKSI